MSKHTTLNTIDEETQGLTSLGKPTNYTFSGPDRKILEAFPNRHPDRDYRIRFEHPEFTSLCPKTGQPDFGTFIIDYVPDTLCVESKSFKLYMAAYRNHGSFMESITNTVADDLVALLKPRRISVEGRFNVRGGTGISVFVDYLCPQLSAEQKTAILRLW